MSSHQDRSLRHRHPLPQRQRQRQPSQRPSGGAHVFDIMYQNYTPSNIGGANNINTSSTATAKPTTPMHNDNDNNNKTPVNSNTTATTSTIVSNNSESRNNKTTNGESVSGETTQDSTNNSNTPINYMRHDPPEGQQSKEHVSIESPTSTGPALPLPSPSTVVVGTSNSSTPPPQPDCSSNNNKPNANISPPSRPDLSILLNNPELIDDSKSNDTTTVPVPGYNNTTDSNSNGDNDVTVLDDQVEFAPSTNTTASSTPISSPVTANAMSNILDDNNHSNSNNNNNNNVHNNNNKSNHNNNHNNNSDQENNSAADAVAAAKFLTLIRKEFSNSPAIYDSFVDIMKSARMQDISLSEVVGRVQKMLNGKHQLIEAFNRLLPIDYHIADTSDENDHVRQRSSSPNSIGTPGPTPITSAFHFISLIKTRFAEKPEVYQKFAQLLESYSCKRIDIVMIHNEVRKLLADDHHLLAEFSKFMPLSAQSGVLGRRQSNDRESIGTQHSKKQRVHRGDKKLPTGWETSSLFGRIKKFLNNDVIYSDFIKLIELYNQDALDIGTTVRVASEYIKGDEKLLKEFKTFIGYVEIQEIGLESKLMDELDTVRSTDKASESEEQHHQLSSIRGSFEPPHNHQRKNSRARQSSASTQKSFRSKSSASVQSSSTRRITLYELATRHESGRNPTGPFDNDTQCASNLSNNHTTSEYGPGPSYRKIPKLGQKTKCSGRDNLCNDALNDEYASHPIWASEDGGFVASKKNQYEEALHRTEDERYFEDRIIDSGVSTIGLLQLIQNTIDSLPPSQVSNYRPPEYLGGGTEMVYKPALTKIYDKKQQVNEIIHLLHNNPVQTVPTVLKKLTTKVEEWKQKKIHADKNRKVSEVENFYKALDSRSNTFKQIDKKGLSIKSLVSEIEALSFEQHEKDSKHNRNREFQMSFEFKDLDIINDIIRLLEVHNKHRVIYSNPVTEGIEQFYSTFFLPIMKVEGFEPLLSEDPDILPCTAEGLFVNDGLYCFFRIVQLAYKRLEMAKTMSQMYSINPKKTKEENTAQIDITINKVRHHGVELDFRNDCYSILMTLIERLLKGEIDQSTYEACTRYMFGLKAYQLFTFDKLLSSISNQIYMTVTEPDYRSYFDLYVQEETRVPEENISALQLYKLKAESIRKGNENQYVILSTVGAAGGTTLSLSLIGMDDDDKDLEDYKDYVTEFTDWNKESPSVDRSKLKLPFLRRNLRKAQENNNRRNADYFLEAGHEYKICQNTYRLFHVLGKEDYLQSRRL